MRILVTGANGQLGRQFNSLHNSYPKIIWKFCSKNELDITDSNSALNVVNSFNPDYMINCAAYTAVDKAEENQNAAFRVNEYGVSILAQIAKESGIHLVHYSTDYVYDLLKNTPLIETDICQPKSIYGKSKRAGEIALINSGASYTIYRVSWLYSSYNNNFVKTMLKLGSSRNELKIVNDQIGAPTYSKNLAEDTLKVISGLQVNKTNEIYNYCNGGQTTWAEFAERIFHHKSISCKIKGISTEEYGAPAPRPKWSVMNTLKIENILSAKLNHWEESLVECLEELDAMA